MERPPAGAGASGPTITPDAARLVFRQKREAVGYSQIGLSRLLGRSTAYVAHIENGRLNPSPDARAALAARLGESPEILFAGFPTPKEERDAALRRLILRLYDDKRLSEAKTADELGIGIGSVKWHRRAAGHKGRPNLATFTPPAGHLTAKTAAEKYGLDLGRLCDAIDTGTVPGRLHQVAGSHPIRTVDERGLEKYLENRPRCGYDGCDKPAAIASNACGGPHATALKTRGPWWDSEDGARFLGLLTSGEIRPTCWLCGTEKSHLAPAHFAKAWREDRRLACTECGPLWITALITARSRAFLATTPMRALEAALEVAERFEQDVRGSQRGREGRPRSFAVDLLIEALFVGRGLSRTQVSDLLNRAVREGRLSIPGVTDGLNVDYVRTRQKRALIKRRAAQ